MTCTINRAQIGDEAALARIQTESWKAAFCHILPPEELARCTDAGRVTAMYRRLLEQNYGHGYLLRVDGEPHGIAWWSNAREPQLEGIAELICIHCLPGKWRSGYGTRMMNAVLADVAAAGYPKVMLWVFEKNERARRFYEKNGFVCTGRVKPGDGPTEVCYEKEL